mmetsp:Transcript_29892/g.45302  ORF Transcript_29892/g.45302 Transcript_29892/m.45302 type:complete len:140 (+) Transcript_29892:142-561(+)|eukprot:CAMPEP_0178924922 /NCGR_PEP_ID=MMETSP0786-20121207/17601_1 /TAXON_ID=186022 /ORGANISM="Thalassionema frauenfeldii, Strain CCMP 1798" /LENGTH=139 /DNA_ID=CAMNT_0020599697 /DNA_START=62 /DNA_END=481 /DNA_ORIENTATION=-
MSVNEVRYSKTSMDLEIHGSGGAATFVIGNEDHTLANALRHILMNNSESVEFAGYSVPHPSDPKVNIRVQTWANGTERKSAIRVLQDACTTLDSQCQHVLEKLEEMIPAVKEDTACQEQRMLEEAKREEEEDVMDEDDE